MEKKVKNIGRVPFFVLILFIITVSIGAEQVLVRFNDPLDPPIKGWDIQMVIPSSVDVVLNESQIEEYAALCGSSGFEVIAINRSITGYSSYDTALLRIEALKDSYPAYVEIYDIGDSWEKVKGTGYNASYTSRDIWALRISDNPSVDEEEFNILIMGEHHARELETTEIVLYIMENLLNDISEGDTFFSALVDNYALWFVPMVNPDGLEVVYSGLDSFWRKNTRDNNSDQSYAAIDDGVDPNRNYDWHWGESGVEFDSTSDVFPGTGPFTEYENIAVRDLATELNPIASLSFHTYGEMILFPFGYDYVYTPDHGRLSQIASSMSAVMDKYSSSEKYDPYMSVFLYPAAGDSDDWLYGELGTLAFTVEAGPSSLGFHPSWSVVEAYLPEQYEGFLSFAQEICSRHIYGCISDAETGLPISGATLKITELYNYSLVRNRYSNTAGNYYWGLTAGDYTLMVSKPGYQTVFHPFSIDQTPQEINIEMQPFESEEIAVKIVPNPAFGSNTVIALEVPQEGWLLNCSIYSIDGSIIYTFPPKTSTINVAEDSFIVDKLRPDGTSLASGIYLVYIKAEKSGGLFKKVLKFAFID